MGAFYRALRAPGRDARSLAEGLRQAQLALMRAPQAAGAGTRGLSLPGAAPWSHPYHWAGYVLYD
jgi:CHAT domain-containing protein